MKLTKVNQTRFDAIDAMLGKTQTVTINGTAIELQPPTEAAVRKLRRVQYAYAPTAGAEPDMDKMADASLDLAVAAVQACLDGLDHARAFRLLLASGGEMGELSRAAMSLCGIQTAGLPPKDARGGAADDLPT